MLRARGPYRSTLLCVLCQVFVTAALPSSASSGSRGGGGGGGSAAAASASLTVDLSAPALRTVFDTYLSVNIDTGSLYNNLDFTSPPLRELTRALARGAPLQLRIGGGAADDTVYTGAGGARGNCSGGAGLPPGVNICVDDSLWAELSDFAGATGARLVWDLNLAVNRTSATQPWDSRNAAALIAHAATTRSSPWAWQLGNEIEDWYKRNPPLNLTGARLAADYAALRALLLAHAPAVSTRVYGPDACCEERHTPQGGMLHDFAAQAASLSLAAITFHEYPLPRAADRSCLPQGYQNMSEIRGYLAAAIDTYAGYAAPALAAGVPLVLGETATTALGGCDGLSNRFVAGFTFIHTLGAAAERGVAQVNRQDLVGWSSQTTPSSYALLGAPGWSRGAIAPHPDYWIGILWKQLLGSAVLASALDNADVDAHVWCAARGGGAVVVTYANPLAEELLLALPPALAALPREEYLLQASPDAANITADATALNGAPLAATPEGRFAYPLPGRQSPPAAAAQLPPFSLGFLVFAGARAAACGA